MFVGWIPSNWSGLKYICDFICLLTHLCCRRNLNKGATYFLEKKITKVGWKLWTVLKINTGCYISGRDITGIRISRGSGTRAFVLQAGEVGADWLSPTILTYIANQLIFSNDAEIRAAAEDFVWYIFPLTNPDGFQFSQDSVSNHNFSIIQNLKIHITSLLITLIVHQTK